MKNIVLAVLLAGWWFQADVPIRIGPTSDRLTAEDLDQIGAIARQEGGRTWLVLGRSQSGVGGDSSVPWEVWAYLRPAGSPGPVRRGALVRLVARLPNFGAFAAPKSWRISASGQWAQVTTPGRTPEKVEDSRDLNRPFAIDGEMSDAILQEVVGVVRSSPSLNNAAGSQGRSPLFTQVQGSWPILAVRLQSDASVEVTLVRDADELSGQSVVLRKTGTRWVVASVSFWIV